MLGLDFTSCSLDYRPLDPGSQEPGHTAMLINQDPCSCNNFVTSLWKKNVLTAQLAIAVDSTFGRSWSK